MPVATIQFYNAIVECLEVKHSSGRLTKLNETFIPQADSPPRAKRRRLSSAATTHVSTSADRVSETSPPHISSLTSSQLRREREELWASAAASALEIADLTDPYRTRFLRRRRRLPGTEHRHHHAMSNSTATATEASARLRHSEYHGRQSSRYG